MSDPIGSGVDSIADGVGRRAEEAWDDGVDRDKKLADDIAELRRVHHEEAARRDGLMRTNEEEHEKLDGADSSAGGVVDALNAARDRHGKRQ